MATYAILETGSKQYWVEPNSVLDVELLEAPDEKTGQISLDKVLLVNDEGSVKVGQPFVKGSSVVCDYLGEVRGKKVISFKFRRRKSSQTKKGHRQNYTRLRVKEIKA